MVSNSDMIILSGIGFLSLGSLAFYSWQQWYINVIKLRQYNRRINQLKKDDAIMAPENLKDYFKNMIDEEKSIGKEL